MLQRTVAAVAAVVAWKYCLSKIQGGGPLELLEVAENGRFAW